MEPKKRASRGEIRTNDGSVDRGVLYVLSYQRALLHLRRPAKSFPPRVEPLSTELRDRRASLEAGAERSWRLWGRRVRRSWYARPVDVIWGLGARYCVRQDAHVFTWLWGLFLALAGAAFMVRRRGRHFEAAALVFLAICSGALGLVIFYACYASAPYSMGLGAPSISAARLTALTCLSHGAFALAFVWTVVALSCSAAVGLIAWGRSRGATAALRACPYIGAALLLLVAAAAGFASFFDFSWCSSRRLF
jgi:hypothetical protein